MGDGSDTETGIDSPKDILSGDHTIGHRARLVLSLGIPAALMLLLAFKLLWGVLAGVQPVPVSPPWGYLANEKAIRLVWRNGSHEGPVRVQLAKGELFDSPVLDRKVKTKGRTGSLRSGKLDPGTRYCWRVIADSEAWGSCFETAGAVTPL